MMKWIKLLLVLSLATAAYAAQPTQVYLTWTESFNTVPVCSTSVTTNCVSGFQVTEPVTGLSAFVPSTGGTNTTVFSYSQTPLPAGGSYTYTVVAVEIYSGGTITSGPATVVVAVPKSPDVPTSLTGVVK
mgnify:FL=1